MEYVKIKVETTVVIPQYTAEEWELYTHDGRDCSKAVKALNLCLVEAVRMLKEKNLTVNVVFGMICYPVMYEFGDCGASDTEPRNIMWDALEKFMPRSL